MIFVNGHLELKIKRLFETTRPNKAELHAGYPILRKGKSNICINGPGNMTKMASMPIYGKNL